jgi:hypothetical protein
MLHQLRVHRQILYGLAVNYLEPMHGCFERLAYLASLRNLSTGIYGHELLGREYGEQPVNESLETAHQEVFEGLLELPFAQQEQDLRAFLKSRPAESTWTQEDFESALQNWVPPDTPGYLKDLFRSNLGALNELLQGPPPKARSGK